MESLCSHRNKNKWQNQQIHKKYNKIQRASKHYGKPLSYNIIYKRKKPIKQRKDYKKFLIQQKRKEIYKQMTFDFDDFIFKNKNENYKRIRIQIKRTINSNYHIDIKSIYDQYYYDNYYSLQQQPKPIPSIHDQIHDVTVTIKLYQIANTKSGNKYLCMYLSPCFILFTVYSDRGYN